MNKKITKSKAIQIRVTDEEYAAIEEKAKALHLSMSDYVRMVSITAEVKVKSSLKL